MNQNEDHKHIVIIGAGDLSANRLVPALLDAGYDPENVHIFGLAPCPFQSSLAHTDLRLCKNEPDRNGVVPALLTEAKRVAQEYQAPVVVASPSFAHFGYVKELLDAGLLVGCEKPLSCFAHEVQAFQKLTQTVAGNRLFGFSYYALEKGLPLTYLMNPLMKLPPGLLRMTDAKGEPLMNKGLENLRRKVSGTPRNVRIMLLEGGERSNASDYRGWTLDPRYGGNPIETGLHTTLLASLARTIAPHHVGEELSFTTGLLEGYPETTPPTYGHYRGVINATFNDPTRVNLIFGKHMAPENTFRGGCIEYWNGTKVNFDFDKKSLEVVSKQGKILGDIEVIPKQNYAAQVRQFLHFVNDGGWPRGHRSDFAREQLEMLTQLTTLPNSQIPIRYGTDPLEQRRDLTGLRLAPQHADKVIVSHGPMAFEASAKGAVLNSIVYKGQEYTGRWLSSTGAMIPGLVMAPIVGQISESGRFIYKGKAYEPGKHGFARRTVFRRVPTKAGVRFEHHHDPYRNAGLWPLPVDLSVDYHLARNELTTNVALTNLSYRFSMPFGCGLHPAYHWPFPGADDKTGHVLHIKGGLPEDTAIYRPQDGKVYDHAFGHNPFCRKGYWKLNEDNFLRDAYFFVLPPEDAAKPIELGLAGGNQTMKLSLQGWDGFGVWSKPGEENTFLCLEPFKGLPLISRQADPMPQLQDIEGLSTLPPRGTFNASTRLSFTPRYRGPK
jgi:galactose mutarotase-like enzyme/predicted dehydrogenase